MRVLDIFYFHSYSSCAMTNFVSRFVWVYLLPPWMHHLVCYYVTWAEDILYDYFPKDWILSNCLSSLFYSFYKWTMRQLLNASELERLLIYRHQQEPENDAEWMVRVESCFCYSKSPLLALYDTLGHGSERTSLLRDIKKIKQLSISHRLHDLLNLALARMITQCLAESNAEKYSRIRYDSSNAHHERLLGCLWEIYMKPKELSQRKSDDWQLLGFQGVDPATDFRGMGILALEQLLYFGKMYPQAAQDIRRESSEPFV